MSKRAYKPTALKVLEGNRSKIKDLGEDEPKPRPKTPLCPSDINHAAKAVWRRLSPTLERLGLLTEADGDMFASLCQIRGRLVFLHRELQRKDKNTLLSEECVLDDDGNRVVLKVKAHPYVVMEKHYYALLRAFAGEFGLSPRGRTGLKVGTSESDDGEDLLT